jgi:hypothetical protein
VVARLFGSVSGTLAAYQGCQRQCKGRAVLDLSTVECCFGLATIQMRRILEAVLEVLDGCFILLQ